MPSILYKYYPPERMDFFETFTVRFTCPEDFNDLFDSTWRGRTSDTDAFFRESRFRKRLGILCLTEDPDNQLMWVHYAARHSGSVVGFDTGAEVFSEGDGALQKVRYEPPPTAVDSTSREFAVTKRTRGSTRRSGVAYG